MPNPFAVGGMILGGLGSLGKAIFGGGQRREARRIKPIWEQYTTSPYAAKQLGTAQQLFSGRMAGASDMERNIAQNQASALNRFQRGATDASQLLALGGAAQGMTNEAYADLATAEKQNKLDLLQNLNQAYQTMTNEKDKEYQSKLMKYQMDVAQKQALLGGGASNIFGGIGDLASLGILAGQYNFKRK